MDRDDQAVMDHKRYWPGVSATTFEDGSRMIVRLGVQPEAQERAIPVADHSILLQRMIRRRDELLTLRGEPDATGDRLVEILTDLETTYLRNAEGAYEAGEDWLKQVGEPEPDEWDTWDEYDMDRIKRWRLD